jgi:hypothetical protein
MYMLKISTIIIAIVLLSWIKLPSVMKQPPVNGTPLTIDGPYVLYNGDSILVQYIDSANGLLSLRINQLGQSQKDQLLLDVHTDEPGKAFKVKLQPKLTVEKSTYGKPKKMLVISDIEGEFTAFRRLLQGNGVIDANYQWTYGEGHLVLIGDFVDRGTMVTEVLWLIYSLESQAEAAGGKVHYILGNHEIMNMNGEHHYVHPRYKAHADSMHVSYLQLFGKQSELGRWLSTKNITERIGNVLFSHAGFSSYMNEAQMPLKAINDTARLYYTDTSSKFPSAYSELIFSDYSPFWYRGYYYGAPRATLAQVDSTLDIYDCKYIVTGHTVIANEIVSVYKGKVINTDLHHKQGHSEALLFDAGKIYRVNSKGQHMTVVELK